MNEKWMTVKEVAEYLQLSTDLIYRLAQQVKIPVSKIGNRWRFRKERIDQWMDKHPAIPTDNWREIDREKLS